MLPLTADRRPPTQVSLPLHLVQRVLAKAFGVLLEFDLLRAASDLDFRAVVQVTGFGALKPNVFSVFFCHFYYL
jgi:hypothetical protein